MLIDTHSHVNFTAFKEDADVAIRRALDEGTWMVNVGTQIDTSREAVKFANQYPEGVYAVIGLHPVHTYSQHLDEEETSFKSREEIFNTEEYIKLGQDPKVVGIGECGLDYYRLPEQTANSTLYTSREQIKQLQKDAFIAQIRLAKELDKALVIHCRPSTGSQDAYEDILQILDVEFGNNKFYAEGISSRQISNFKWEIHSFTGSPEGAQEFLKRGAYVGMNGIITFDKTGNMEAVVKAVPLERIVLETDSPYLTPIPHRGKRNEPSYVKHVAKKVAQIKNVDLKEVESITTVNAKNLFNLV